ncbi:hypothetical protein GKZ90_0012445 [Flavobacterium sp. MC2016-06]|jgi:hypothetical protein|uniref:hypothetical protein n=1 Tax=Flavobacterium sp. MC2016-06 TaxID=2676308 RepID=UPI0012BA6D2A|nr:hypothetical protein [Flavobacterium sp. MC2016-06]MBU3860119.1 hypothetical protein [Flavobacterium sp. MC2016-06]
MKHLKLKFLPFLIAISFALTSCTSTKTALFDQYSYQKTTELKVEVTQLMNKATTPYAIHKKEVETLFLDIEKLSEYEKNKSDNEITFAMWKILTDKEKNLLAGFFKNWEAKGIISPVFLEESKKQVLDALDLLIQYEIKKDKESKDQLLDLINLNS